VDKVGLGIEIPTSDETSAGFEDKDTTTEVTGDGTALELTI
jgi:hypothetical protein